MTKVELHYGAATDVGRVREVNEDAFLADPPVFVVADGMGGHEGGDVASAIVVEEFGALAGQDYDARAGADQVATTLRACQRRIAEYGVQQASGRGRRWYAGTTAVVALLVHDDEGPRWLVANLGDSRAYRVGPDGLERVSVDHSVVQELVDAGQISEADVATHPERHVITRALGGPDPAEADFFQRAAGLGRAAGAVHRRRHRDDRRRRDRDHPPRDRRPPGRGRPVGGGGRVRRG